jgi:signal transduction histidine kinase
MRLPPARSLIVFALVVAAIVNAQALVLSIRAHTRFRESVFATVRAHVTGIRAALGQRIAMGGLRDRESALRQAIADSGAESVAGFDMDGTRLETSAGEPASRHWPSTSEIAALRSGAVLVGPEPGSGGGRVIAYTLVALPEGPLVLRFTSATPELDLDRREWRQMFLGHAVTLLVLLLVGGLVLAPRRAEKDSTPPRALIAYEEAMERLRDHGEELTVRHETERRELEEVLRDKEALARAGELTAGIVHEMRNGLGTIVGYARLIENANPAGAENAISIREECETLEAVIRRFMDFVKRETLVLGPVDVSRMLVRVAERETQRPGAPVAVEAGGAGSIIADEVLLERAFENLVRNAREAAGPGGHVWMAAVREGDFVSVTVSDDGPGLSPATRSALRPFFTTKAGGLGLGLAITLKIVRLHDGVLTLGERSPRGAAVTARLPTEGPAHERSVTERSGEPPADPDGRGVGSV